MTEGGKKAILAAFFANLGISIIKFLAFLATGAASLLAECLHSLADTGNQALLLLGAKRSKKDPTPEHPFGYGPERYFWSFVVALVLFTLGGLFALYEGIEKLRHPHELSSPIWGFIVLTIAILLESYSLRTAIIETNHVRGNQSFWHFIRHAKQPELPVVLLEDIGAMTGLVFALMGLTAATVTDNARYDAIGSISIGILLIIIAYILAREMKSLLIGESVDPDVAEKIRSAVLEGDEVASIIHMRTLHHGPDNILLGVKVEFSSHSDEGITQSINAVETRVRAAVPTVQTIYIEPDIRRQSE
ncbi:MAG TPA: cation diffusion facilitator family transporter [Acidimicrobiia bacterium]|nr:cation diffusion facilitator family transporter [Acidimicrobiia bacterium]